MRLRCSRLLAAVLLLVAAVLQHPLPAAADSAVLDESTIMRHLRQRMHARIGAARAIDHGEAAVDGGDRALQHILHRGTASLRLPAGERNAIIFNREFVTWHIGNDYLTGESLGWHS